jgi:hypothetical protein
MGMMTEIEAMPLMPATTSALRVPMVNAET